MDAYSTQLEYSVDKKALADHADILIHYLQTGNFHFNQTAPSSGNNNGDPTDMTFNIQELAVVIELDGVLHSKFDVAFNYLYSNVNAHGTIYTPVSESSGGAGTPNSSIYVPMGGFGCAPNSITGQGCDTDLYGGVGLISMRYKILPKAYIGGEYEFGDRNTLYFEGGADQMTGFYGTPGTGGHLYWTEMFTPTASLRVGGYYQNYQYSGIGYSAASIPVNLYVTNYYANFRVDF